MDTRDIQQKLEELRIKVQCSEYEGDSSYPQEWTLVYGKCVGRGPTLEQATVQFIAALLRAVPLEYIGEDSRY
jgi:hypothetical protein